MGTEPSKLGAFVKDNIFCLLFLTRVTANRNFCIMPAHYSLFILEVNVCCICYEPFAQLNYVLTLNITHATHILCLSLLKRKAQVVCKKYFLGQ